MDTDADTLRWYVLQSKPKQEARAGDNLRAWGIEIFLPRLLRLASRRDGMQQVIEPLFPSYLFARFDMERMGAKVRYTRGVSKILGTSCGPNPVEEQVIDEIRRRMDATGVVRATPTLRPGDRVRVVGGTLKDFVGVFEHSATAAHRVTLLLATLHSQMHVAVDRHLVECVR